ncbi:hypothetical protein [Pseudogracilibacillus auburnensis]|uniref:hypothetical protein n=1 Tax=Pseudogracilibacillus auburnensis TaxID=1494959 RepID=UPI001A95E21B|nr:hypothetical protein [Pseudogracilibacillus auburnensis]MBO1005910.1 hypothetical protein [Pseudogracilibacillus auburnensis]
MGNADNWFNDAYNNNEDIRISSFVRVLSVIGQELDLSEYKLGALFDEKILKIASLVNTLSDEDDAYVESFIQADRSIFIDLLGDWGSLDYRKKLNKAENDNLDKIRDFISQEEDN